MPAPISGQVALSVTPQPLSATPQNVSAFTIKAPAGNAQRAYVGPAGVSSSTGFPLDPGDEITIQRQSQNGQPSYQVGPADFYVVGTTLDVVGWLGMS